MAKNIEPNLKLISEYLKLKKSENFVIPEYQRGYSWNITQCDKLWQDIETFIDSDASDPYFFGTIIVDCSEENKFSLIDGQQRTTTFLLLLKALFFRLKEVLNKFKRSEDSEALEEGLKDNRNKIIRILYKAEVEDRIEILKNWEAVKEITILENNSINEQYKKELKRILDALDFDNAEKSVSKIPRKQKDNKYTNHFRNFKFFYSRLCEKSESQLNVFAKVFLEKCQIIEIRSWQIEQAITMFNSLNSTGMPLSDADIISAQLYSNAGEDKTNFNIQWENINRLANTLNIQKIVNIDAVLQQFMYINRAINKEYIKEESVDVTTPGLRRYYTEINKELLYQPLQLCNNLLKITKIWNEIKDYPIVKLLLKFNENVKLFLIGFLFCFEPDDISQKNVLEISECLLRLFTILELVDTGYSSRNFKTFLFGQNIKLVNQTISIVDIKSNFDEHIHKFWDKTDLSISLEEYDKNNLILLNEYLYSKEKSVLFDFAESVNIEHIMPASGRNIDSIKQDADISDRDEFDNLVNKIGNKILLEQEINKSIGNQWFKTKKQTSINEKTGYKNSKYSIALALTNYPKDTWTKEDITLATAKATKRIIRFIFDE